MTVPAGALIERSGKPVDRTPAAFDLAPGSTTLRVSLDGYEAETLTFDLAPGSTVDRSIALRPGSGPRRTGDRSTCRPAAATAPARGPRGAVPRPPHKPPPVAHPRIKVLDDSDSL